jgi:ABC-2 type transport system permease protein
MTKRALLRSWRLELKCEFLKMLRTPSYVAGTMFFPLMFYMLFGVAIAQQKASMNYMSRYLLATYGAGGVIGAVLFGFAVTLAIERGMGWLQLRYTTPNHPGVFFFAKAAVSLVFAVAVIAMLFSAGALFANVRMPAAQWLLLGGVLVAGTVPFAALALAVGYFASPTAAPAIVNTIYMPMCFLSGLWVPLQMFPQALQNIAPALPGYHLGQLALRVIGFPVASPWGANVVALFTFTLAFGILAYIGHWREKQSM